MDNTVWLFEVEKRGRGWCVLNYISDVGKIPCITNSEKHSDIEEHKTISKVKEKFKGSCIFACVFEYDITAPSTIYQMVIECNNEIHSQSLKDRIHHMRSMEGVYHVDVPWIDTAPKEFIKKLKEY